MWTDYSLVQESIISSPVATSNQKPTAMKKRSMEVDLWIVFISYSFWSDECQVCDMVAVLEQAE